MVQHQTVGSKISKQAKAERINKEMKNTQYNSPIQSLLESLKENFANTVNPKSSLEVEQLVVDGFLAHQRQQEKKMSVRGVLRKVSEFEK